MASLADQRFLADLQAPFCSLNVKESWEGLTENEKLYAHWMSRASWEGSRIIMNEWSEYGEDIHDFLITLFSTSASKTRMTDLGKLKADSGVDDENWGYLLSYTAQVLSNMVNYKSFGNSKFTPRCHLDVFEAVISASENKDAATALWSKIRHEIYALEPEGMNFIGKPSAGHRSNYYPGSPSITDAEVNAVQELCNENGVNTANSRLKKTGPSSYTLLIASASTSTHQKGSTLTSKTENPITVTLQKGDFSKQLTKVNAALKEAAKYSANENQKNMLSCYVDSFENGDVDAHKAGSRYWVQDFGPVVETYIGFIEDYVDPYGARAEWEGFVAIVNKEQSKKYGKMVDEAENLIQVLPWGKDFEVDKFKRPDFTSLEILTFCTGGIPVGINIPNYHEIRETLGFKNVSLGNILNARSSNEPATFIHPDEEAEYKDWSPKTFGMQVANHELLGHGTGKLLAVDEKGNFNFDKGKVINPLTGKPVETWYKPGQTWSTQGGSVGSSMEECRAEAVALFLAPDERILKLFGHESKEEQELLIYYTFVDMCRAGLRGLEFYEPQSKKHGQAHMQARVAIFKWLYTHDLATIEEVRDESGTLTNAYIKMNKATVLSRGQEVIGRMLVELQVRKSTADPNVVEWYTELSRPLDEWLGELRDLVLSKKLPRKIFVQGNTYLTANGVELKEYDLSNEGTIQSWIERDV